MRRPQQSDTQAINAGVSDYQDEVLAEKKESEEYEEYERLVYDSLGLADYQSYLDEDFQPKDFQPKDFGYGDYYYDDCDGDLWYGDSL